MVYLPKSLQVYYKIKKDIEQHYYARFSFLPAERKLSELYQVQRSTVRKALEKLTEENYIIKKPGAGNQVIWSNAKTSNSAQSILYVIPSHEFEQRNQPFHWEIFTVLESLCRAENITLSFLKLNKNDTLSSLSHNFQAADGIIWVTEINPIFFETAKKNAIPSVLICNNYPDFPRINLADRDGIFMATNHLIKKGCKRIAFMRGLSSYMNTPARYEGYQLALRAHNITPDPSLEIDGDWTYSNAISAITDAIAHGLLFDGIVCSNDLMALGTIRALSNT